MPQSLSALAPAPKYLSPTSLFEGEMVFFLSNLRYGTDTYKGETRDAVSANITDENGERIGNLRTSAVVIFRQITDILTAADYDAGEPVGPLLMLKGKAAFYLADAPALPF